VAKDMTAGADTLGKGAPGGDLQSAALKSTLAASSAMMESLNQATRQFAELSEATMKAAAAQMVKGFGKN
jgi:gamma-glutamyl:cysteine ligase YbdK (ATP-grasp superfamily)